MNTIDLLQIASGILALGTILCYLTVLLQSFMQGEEGMGLTCIALTFCCGIGGLVTFGYGWSKANEWDNVLLMLAWTCCFLMSLGVQVALIMMQHPA